MTAYRTKLQTEIGTLEIEIEDNNAYIHHPQASASWECLEGTGCLGDGDLWIPPHIIDEIEEILEDQGYFD